MPVPYGDVLFMGNIKVLPEAVANKIAAGEVVERPASIVKELIENSLDAGAASLEIEIRHGGKSLIRVADDGSGMGAEDIELAFQRHATSKIFEASDLDHIATYGFRGEALPSIAAVSRVQMTSRKKESREGAQIQIEGGRTVHVKPVPCAPGTVVEVRDLFFNTPARRKFMRSDNTETGHVVDTVSHMALSRLDVRFLLKSADKVLFDLLPTQDLKSRAAVIFGQDSRDHLLEIQGESQGLKLYGVIAKPSVARTNRLGQIFFVNRRWVKTFSLSYGLQAGYHGLLMHGQYPVAVLFLDLDLERVDVNVHPTKQEVRISNESQVKSLIQEWVARRLAGEPDLAPKARIGAAQLSTSDAKIPSAETLQTSFTLAEEKAGYGASQTKRTFLEEPALYSQVPSPPLPQAIPIRGKLKITKILGQVHNTFILAETDEGFMVVDQHAAHERVQYEALLKTLESGQAVRQGLLMDEVLELSIRQSEILKEAIPLLNRLGFEIEVFGERAFIIRAVPAILTEENAVTLLQHYVEEKEEGKIQTRLEDQKSEVAALIACKRRSVKAHESVRPEFVQGLLEQLSVCENPFGCPHGRPSFLKYTFSELEKQFKRKL